MQSENSETTPHNLGPLLPCRAKPSNCALCGSEALIPYLITKCRVGTSLASTSLMDRFARLSAT